MPKKVLVNLDLSKNQLLNVALQNLSSAPSAPVAGQIYFNTTDARIYFWDGTAWVDISGDLRSIIGGAGITATVSADGDEVTLDVNVDNTTIEIVGDTVRVKDLGISTAKLADNAVTTVKVNNNAVTLAKIAQISGLRVLGNLTGSASNVAEVVVVTDLASASSTTLATSQSIKTYIDSAIGGLGNLEGGWSAAGGTFPVGSSPVAGTKKGDYWYVTVAGTVDGESFNIGDVIIAAVDNASTTSKADWIRLEVNRDQATNTVLGVVMLANQTEVNTGTDSNKVVTPATLSGRTATETRTGIAEIATQAETDTGTDDTRIVTPLKLKAFIDARVGGFAANVGNGTNTSFVITHNLNTRDVSVSVFDNANFEEVFTDVALTTVNTITVSFATAPASNAYRVVIKK
jgi:hypothetical protein